MRFARAKCTIVAMAALFISPSCMGGAQGSWVSIDVEAGPLHLAAAANDIVEAERLLVSGLSVDDRPGPSRATPLHFAARDGRLDAARLLVAKGADVQARTAWDVTPLHLAASSRFGACASGKQTDVQGLSEGHFAVASFLISHGAIPDAQDLEGVTPLVNAAECNDAKIASLLIEHGADINHRSAQYSVLDMAMHWGPDVAQLLIEKGVDVDTETPFSYDRPIFEAVTHGRLEILEMILDRGVDIDVRHGRTGQTALHYAMATCHPAIYAFLLERGADTSIRDADGKVPADIKPYCPN